MVVDIPTLAAEHVLTVLAARMDELHEARHGLSSCTGVESKEVPAHDPKKLKALRLRGMRSDFGSVPIWSPREAARSPSRHLAIWES